MLFSKHLWDLGTVGTISAKTTLWMMIYKNLCHIGAGLRRDVMCWSLEPVVHQCLCLNKASTEKNKGSKSSKG